MADDARFAVLEAELTRELDAIGLCPWLQARQPEMDAHWHEATIRERMVAELDAHTARCDQCQRRQEAILRITDDMSTPSERIFFRSMNWLDRRPEWLRPAIGGAVALGTLTLVRVALSFAFGQIPFRTALDVLGMAVGVGAAAGLVGGNSYRLLKPKAAGWGALGPYLAGFIFSFIIGLATALVLWAIPATSEGFREGWAWRAFGILILISGPLLGWFFFRPKREGEG